MNAENEIVTYEVVGDGKDESGILCNGVRLNDKEIIDRLERHEEIRRQVINWANAYPENAFPEPDFKAVQKALEEKSISLGCVSASSMRHVISRVAKLFQDK